MRVGRGTLGLGCVFAVMFGAACKEDDTSTPSSTGTDAAAADAGADAASQDAGVMPEQPGAVAHWTMMGGDHRNHYHAADSKLSVANARELQQKWMFEVAGFPPGSPVVVDGVVYVMATGGSYAIDLKTGKEIWKRMDIAGSASPAYADGFVYLHTSRANLYKVAASDGSTVWGPVRTYELPTCDGTSSPIVAHDKVLVGHSCGAAEVTGNADQDVARGGVEAFFLGDGARAWTYYTVPESGENGAMVWSSVGVDLEARVVYATTGNNYTYVGENSDAFHAIDLETGARIWKNQVREGDVWSRGSTHFVAPTGPSIDTDFGANPILLERAGRKLVAAGDKASAFWVLDRETGELVWNREELSARHSAAYGGVLMNGAFDGEHFYVAVNEPPMQSILRVLNVADGSDAHEPLKLGASVWGAPSLANGLLFVPVNSVLRVYDTKNLELLTSFDTGGTIAAGAAVVSDGHVVVQSGLMYGFANDALPNNKIICYALDGQGGEPEPDAGMAVAGEPTWSAIYDEIIVGTGCSGSPLCHGGGTGLGNLAFATKQASYDALVGVKAMGTNLTGDGPNCKDLDLVRVKAGSPDESLLVQKVSGTQPCGDSMPPGATLNADQIRQIRAWIEAGAKND